MNTLDGLAVDIECCQLKVKFELNSVIFRGLIDDKEGNALPNFLDVNLISARARGEEGTICPPIGFALPNFLYNYAPVRLSI